MYKDYLLKLNNGIGRSQAKSIGSSVEVSENLVREMYQEDVDELMRELGRSDYLTNFYADNIVFMSTINDKTIVYMENRFKNSIKDVVDFISKLK